MTNIRNTLLWIGLTLAIAVGAVWQYVPLADASSRLNGLPLHGPSFEGINVPLSAWENTFFKDANVIKRLYTVGQQKCFLTILDGTNNRHVVHDPSYCFRGGGWSLVEQRKLPLPDGYASILVMKKGIQRKEALVWFSDASQRHASAFLYFFQTTLRRLTFGYSGQEPVLVILQPVNNDPLDWEVLVRTLSPLKKL